MLLSLLLLFSSLVHAESRVKIAVIDTGLIISKDIVPYMCRLQHQDFTGTGLYDTIGHGTNVSYLIAKRIDPEKHCLLILKWYSPYLNENTKINNLIRALAYSISQNVNVINLSMYGPSPVPSEKLLIRHALERGIILVVSAGNDGVDLDKNCNAYPACYGFKHDNFFIVANYEKNRKTPFTNYNGPVNVKENGQNQEGGGFVMSGTSMSCGVFTGKLINKIFK